MADNGFTKIPDGLLEAFCRHRINGEAMQIILSIIRKTYGYNKKEDWISNSQFNKMTDIKKGNICRALSKLITNNIVIQTDNKLRVNESYEEWISFKSLSKVITGKKNQSVIQRETTVIQRDNDLLSKERDTIDNKDNITKDTLLHNGTWQSYEDKFDVYKFQRIDNLGYKLLSKENPPRPKMNDMTTEHKWIYLNEKELKELPEGLHINHINKNKIDNRIKNLELLTNSQHRIKHLKEDNFVDNRNPELQSLMDFAQEHQFSLQGSVKQNRQYAYNLLRKKDDKGVVLGLERVKWLVLVALKCRGVPYAPQVNDFKTMFYKWQDLLGFSQKEKNERNKHRIG